MAASGCGSINYPQDRSARKPKYVGPSSANRFNNRVGNYKQNGFLSN